MLSKTIAIILASTILSGGAQPDQVSPPAQQKAKPRKAHRHHKAKPACRSMGRFKATVYGPPWNAMEGGPITAMGHRLRPGRHLIAVDPRVIRLGSLVRVWPNPLRYRGAFMAADTGGAIRGKHIDVFVWQGRGFMDRWGVKPTKVCVLRWGR